VAAIASAVLVTSSSMLAADEPSVDDGLATALAFVTPKTANLGFTDWKAMKASNGLEALTSSIPEDIRIGAMIELTRVEAPYASFGLDRLIGHAEAWGWDSTDLDWEAALFGDEGGVAVLRFREGFDLAPFIARLDEHGFDEEAVGDVVIRSHEMDLTEGWLRTTDFGILNTALLPDGRTLVLASGREALDATLANDGGPATELLEHVASGVGPIHSVIFEFGSDICGHYDPRLFPDVHPDNATLIDDVLPLRAWDALALTTGRDATGEPHGRLLLSFPTADDAGLAAEAEKRGRLARDGISPRMGEPFADVVFTASDGVADAGVVTIDLQPIDGRLTGLASAVLSRDLLPAMCGA